MDFFSILRKWRGDNEADTTPTEQSKRTFSNVFVNVGKKRRNGVVFFLYLAFAFLL